MAKRNSSGDELLIKLGLQGQEQWDAFRKQLKSIAGEVKAIATEIGRIENIGKATIFRDMMAGGKEKYLAGVQFQASRKAQSTMRMGTETGQTVQNIKDEIALLGQAERAMKSELALAQAKNVQLNITATEIKKITDLNQLSAQIDATRLRRAQEYLAGNKETASVLKEQLTLLRQQEAALKAKPVVSPADKLATSRQQNMQRLFGDGGAGLLTIQAGLMANYAALNAATSGISASIGFAVELDAALRNLQAITVTTDTNMGALKETIISVAEQTKFSAVEVANAAITLGQAGMSVKQIESSIGAVALLATATGTDLSKAVDVATATLDVFNLEAGQMGHVADVLTSAVNQSKLNIEKLTLGLQYAGNTAAQSGGSFEELTAALGAMSNAGIRSGSTLGTGMRQILISLEKPSEVFLEKLAALGLTMEDVNIASNGIYGSLKNLRDAGFTASDAIQSFEVRGAAAFTALSGNLDDMLSMEQGFVNSTAAIRANETQMRSFANVLENFKGVLLSVIETGIQPYLLAARDVLLVMTDWLEQVRVAKPLIQFLTASIVSLAAAFALLYPVKLVVGLVKMVASFRLVGAAAATAAEGIAATTTAAAGAGVLTRFSAGLTTIGAASGVMGKLGVVASMGFRAMLGPIGLVITALGLGVTAWMAYNSESEVAARTIDQLRTDFDNANGSMTEQADKVSMVTGEIEHLNNRYESLTKNQRLLDTEITKARNQFADMGMDVNKPINSVGELITELERLRTQLSEDYTLTLKVVQESINNMIKGQETELKGDQGQISELTTQFNDAVNKANLLPQQVILDILGQLQDPNLEPAQLKSLIAQLNNRQVELAADAGTANTRATLNKYAGVQLDSKGQQVKTRAPSVTTYALIEQELIGALQPMLDAMVPRVSELAAAKTEQVSLARAAVLDTQKKQPGYGVITDTVQLLKNDTSKVMDTQISAADSTDVSGRGKAAADALVAGQARLEALRAEIEQYARATNLDEELRQGLLSDLSALDASLIEKAQPYIDAGKKEDEALHQLDMQRITDEMKTVNEKLQKSTKFDEMGDLAGQLTDLYLEQNKKKLAAITASDATFNEKQAQREAVQRELDANLEELGKTMTAQGVDFQQTELDVKMQAIQNQIDSLQVAREASKDPAQIDELVNKIVGLITQRGELDVASANLAGKDQVFIDALGVRLDAEILAEKEAGTSQKTDLLDAIVDQFKQKIEDAKSRADMADTALANQMDEAKTAADVQKIAQQRVALQMQLKTNLLAIVSEIEALGVNFDDTELAELIFAISEHIRSIGEDSNKAQEDLAKVAADEAEKVASDRMEQLKADEEAKKSAFENAKALAKEAIGQANRANALKVAFEALAAYLKAVRDRVAAEFADAPPGVLGAKLDTVTTDIELPETRDLNDIGSGKGGGGGGGKPKSAIQKATDDLDARVKAYASMLEARLISGASGIGKVDGLVSDIKTKISEIDSQIAGMQSEVDGGSMSEEQMTRLNELLAARKTLTDDIIEAEAMLTSEMVKQGDYMAAMANIARGWAQQNLDVAKTFQQGFEGVLSTMTSGFAQLFTDLVSGTKSAGQAFRDFAASVVKSLLQMVSQMIAVYIMQKLIGMVFPGAQAPGSLGAIAQQVAGITPSMTGGAVRKAGGGMVEGTLARDSKLHNLMPGEYVLRKSAVDAVGVDALDQLNAMGNRAMASGGHVGVMSQKKGPIGQTNVYVVSPDQQPVPGPADIIAVINDDIARGGSTKKLIKTVAMGF